MDLKVHHGKKREEMDMFYIEEARALGLWIAEYALLGRSCGGLSR